MRAWLTLFLLLPLGCGDSSDDTPPPPADSGTADSGGGTDTGTMACVPMLDMCDEGGSPCCDLNVCRPASVGAYCVHIEDTCFVGAREAGCCLDDFDCQPDGRCHLSQCRQMGDGICKDVPPTGSCWSDRDCPAGGTCFGAEICPCGTDCLVEDMPGTCT